MTYYDHVLRAVRVILVTVFALLFTGLAAQAAAPVPPTNIAASLVSESNAPAYGPNATIALSFKPKPGWHGYWSNPGEAGFPARLEWKLPPGVTISAPRYPVPQKLEIAGLMNHVFNGNHALLFTLTLPKAEIGTKLPIGLTADWLACTDQICVPEHGELSLDLTVGNGTISPESRAQFDAWRAALPQPLGSQALFERDGKALRIGIPFPASLAIKDPWFFAATEKAINPATIQKVSRNGDMLTIETSVSDAAPARIEGVLAIGGGRGLAVAAVPGAVAKVAAAGSDWSIILLALGGAILGGLILNIMPCVFPIISLKALSLARSSGDEGAAKRDALAYSAGVILVCVALGGALLALRAGGASVGWAFQLQEPRVILILLMLSVAISANLVGLFELRSFGGGQALVDQGGVAGAFWTGALAAFVATPCTGPFMAAALGAALVLPTAAALAIFAGLGLGMSLPFLLLGFVPALRRMMPKPGAWMGTFQKFLSVPMILTAAALVWLLSRQAGQAGLIIGIVAAIAVTAIALVAGKWQRGDKAFVLPALGTAAIVAGLGAMALGQTVAPVSQIEAGRLGAEPFSEARLNALRSAQRPVFVYFTADWCVTCKVNERVAIETDQVAAAFRAKNVAVLVGDWTNGDPAITRVLEAQGVSGVPLYLYYPGGFDAGMTMPTKLPQVLTPGLLAGLAK
ncbi:MAG: protein-disulfide reductase DsbD family protein [Sphingomonadaceae bacterium]